MPADNEPGLIPAAEAAKMLGCSRQRIHQLVRAGQLAATYKDKLIYLALDQVQERAAMLTSARESEGRLLDAIEVGARFNRSRKSVYRWVELGYLRAIRTGTRRILFDPAVVDAFVPPESRNPEQRKEHRD